MTDNERRQFSRITFDAETLLSQGAQHWTVSLIDLSLKGALIETPDNWEADTSLPFAMSIKLDNGESITMSLRWRHSEHGQIGLECQHIDIDSITHLRRLVELNLGDGQLLERELAALGQQ